MLAVTSWFIYQLKYEARWAKLLRTFIWRLPEECGFFAIMLLLPVFMLVILKKKKSDRILNFQRNIYWYVYYVDEMMK